jgi:hypothetical protein
MSSSRCGGCRHRKDRRRNASCAVVGRLGSITLQHRSPRESVRGRTQPARTRASRPGCTVSMATARPVSNTPGVAGWWKGGPGQVRVGPAVIMGHVRWNTGPAVFSRLHTLQRGGEILIDRADGSTARFVMTRQGKYRKVAFPSDRVYYPTLEPELRLVTCRGLIGAGTTAPIGQCPAEASELSRPRPCGGTPAQEGYPRYSTPTMPSPGPPCRARRRPGDQAAGRYRDNLVVFAAQAS